MILAGLLALLSWFALLPLIYLLGSYLRKWIDEEPILLRGIYVFSFGFAILSYFLVVLGTVGLLKPVPVAIGLALLCFFRWRSLKDYQGWITEMGRYFTEPVAGAFMNMTRAVLWGAFALTVALCFLPEIAHDSLCYHLNLPKLFVRHASILPMTYDLKSYQSQFMEVLFAIGLFLNNVPVAKLFHGFAGFFATIFLILFVDKETQNRGLALFLGLMLWLTPTLLNQVTVTYNDAGVTFFFLLSWALFAAGIDGVRRLRSFFLSGLLLGFAVSCKYLALMFAVPMGLWLAVCFFTVSRGERPLLLRVLGLFCLGIFLGCGYWFIRNYAVAGHSLYPIFSGRLGNPGLYAEQNYASIGVPRDAFSFLKLPFSIVFSPDSFERHSWAGPFYLMLLPFTVYGAFRNSKARFAFLTVFVSTVLWFFTAQNIRFLLPVFPLVMIAAAYGLTDLPRKLCAVLIKRAAQSFAVLALLLLLAAGGYHYRVHLKALFQGWDQDLFLTRLERTYPAAQWINRHLPRNARIYSASEVRQFYFNPPVVDAVSYYRVERYSDKLTPSDFLKRLRKLGITHILRIFPYGTGMRLGEPSNPPYAAIDALLQDPGITRLVKEIPSQNIREPRYRYYIFELLKEDPT